MNKLAKPGKIILASGAVALIGFGIYLLAVRDWHLRGTFRNPQGIHFVDLAKNLLALAMFSMAAYLLSIVALLCDASNERVYKVFSRLFYIATLILIGASMILCARHEWLKIPSLSTFK